MRVLKKVCLIMVMLVCISGVPVLAKSLPTATKVSDYTFEKGTGQTEINARKKVLKIAKSYLNVKEKSSKHKKIIKYYNNIKKNMYRNGKYKHLKATTSMAWCDIFVSVVFWQAGYADVIGTECGCEEHIQLLKKKKCWVEKDSYVPSTGDLIFYDWGDSGKGDNKGWADHVGIVVSVSKNKVITVLEGNYDDTVKYRAIKVNSRYIRGYGVPWKK